MIHSQSEIKKHTIIATTAMGLEAVLNREIKDLGISSTTVSDGKVEFEGTLLDCVKANLWLRTAGKIYIKIGTFIATTFDHLFEETKALPWGDWIGPKDAFPISKITSRKSELFSKSDCQAIVKKAIVEHLKSTHNVQTLPEFEAEVAVRIQIENDIVTLSIDTSGAGLNKRGYRAHHDKAPLRETLAAGLLYLSRWNPKEDVLIDPMCGSGTLLIEAGLMATNTAPGLHRSFSCEQWASFPQELWDQARDEAKQAINNDATYRIYGSDNSEKALFIARKNIEQAQLKNIYVQKLPLDLLQSRFQRGKIISNPPYGERLEDKDTVEKLYKTLGKVLRKNFPEWHYYILTSHKGFESHFQQRATKRRKLFNGSIECCYYQYFS